MNVFDYKFLPKPFEFFVRQRLYPGFIKVYVKSFEIDAEDKVKHPWRDRSTKT